MWVSHAEKREEKRPRCRLVTRFFFTIIRVTASHGFLPVRHGYARVWGSVPPATIAEAARVTVTVSADTAVATATSIDQMVSRLIPSSLKPDMPQVLPAEVTNQSSHRETLLWFLSVIKYWKRIRSSLSSCYRRDVAAHDLIERELLRDFNAHRSKCA